MQTQVDQAFKQAQGTVTGRNKLGGVLDFMCKCGADSTAVLGNAAKKVMSLFPAGSQGRGAVASALHEGHTGKTGRFADAVGIKRSTMTSMLARGTDPGGRVTNERWDSGTDKNSIRQTEADMIEKFTLQHATPKSGALTTNTLHMEITKGSLYAN